MIIKFIIQKLNVVMSFVTNFNKCTKLIALAVNLKLKRDFRCGLHVCFAREAVASS